MVSSSVSDSDVELLCSATKVRFPSIASRKILIGLENGLSANPDMKATNTYCFLIVYSILPHFDFSFACIAGPWVEGRLGRLGSLGSLGGLDRLGRLGRLLS